MRSSVRKRLTMRLAALALFAVFHVGGPAQAFDARDRTFAPGRVGAIVKGATKPEDLARIYGAANVRTTKIYPLGGGDDTSPGVLIHAETADALEVTFSDDGKRIVTVAILGKNWRTMEGLRIGTPLAELERINGGPFELYGFGWDFGGRVQSSGRTLEAYSIFLYTTLAGGTERDDVTGDKTISSRHPALKTLGVEVNLIYVPFDS